MGKGTKIAAWPGRAVPGISGEPGLGNWAGVRGVA